MVWNVVIVIGRTKMKLGQFSDLMQEIAHEGFALHDVIVSDSSGNEIKIENIKVVKEESEIKFIFKE